jgi:hypothetical protein
MNRRFVTHAALGMVALICAVVLLENQADARCRMRRNRNCCCETKCCQEAAPAAEAAPVEAAAPAEPATSECSCECDPCDCGGRHRFGGRLFGRRNHGCCESSCDCS